VSWNPRGLDRLERAISDGTRVQIYRRGTEFIVVPRSLRTVYGAEILVARHPNTGDEMEFRLDEVDHLEILR
jgi:uncharacterized protein with PhoU and TrkA domain